MSIRTPRLYLGTMTFAWNQASTYVDDSIALSFLQKFISIGGCQVDTARIYAGGETEPMLGRALAALTPEQRNGLLVGTKAAPSQPQGLSTQGMRAQYDASLGAVGSDNLFEGAFAEYYLHQPDTECALLESLKEAHALVSAGKVKAIGMSNYHAEEVERAFSLCAEHQLTPPTVYQGLYNPLNRMVEDQLLPLLRKHNCAFIAYNPLAAGLLTGRHKAGGEVPAGRFKENPNYLPRFYTDNNFKAVEAIRAACDDAGITMLDATYVWMLRHSALKDTDGLLLGASNMNQLEQNLNACALATTMADGLPAGVREAFDNAWSLTREGAFPYWRSYSSDMPGRADRDQGASYQAHGPKPTSKQ